MKAIKKGKFKDKSGKHTFVFIERCICSYRCLSGKGSFSVYLLLKEDKCTFSDSSWKECEERLAEFADLHI